MEKGLKSTDKNKNRNGKVQKIRFEIELNVKKSKTPKFKLKKFKKSKIESKKFQKIEIKFEK